MNIVAEFKEFKVDLDNKKCQGATKTTSLKHVEVKASVPNPNLISNIFTTNGAVESKTAVSLKNIYS